MSTHFDLSTYIYSNLLKSKNVPWQFAAAIANCHSKILLRLLRPNFKGWIWHVTDLIVAFHFWLFFTLLPKNHNLKKVKKRLDISSFYNSVPKTMTICYTVTEIWCVMDVIIFHLGLFFTLLPP